MTTTLGTTTSIATSIATDTRANIAMSMSTSTNATTRSAGGRVAPAGRSTLRQAAMLGLALLAFSWLTAPARAQSAPAGITVTGTGTVYGEPDMATVELGFVAVAADVRQALTEADAVLGAIQQAVVGAGVQAADVRTTGFYVWRDQTYDRDGNPGEVRFQVRHAYQVIVRDVAKLGDVISAAVDAGANEVGGIQMSVSDPTALASAARELAMADARAKAAELADLGGVGLGAPIAIGELGSGSPVSSAGRVAYDSMSAMGSVEVGQLAVTVQVQVTFAID